MIVPVHFIEGEDTALPFFAKNPESRAYLKAEGIQFVSLDRAEVVVSRYFDRLVPVATQFGNSRGYIVWTHEPQFDEHQVPIVVEPTSGTTIQIMNIYTGDIHSNNYLYLRMIKGPLTKLAKVDLSSRKAAAMMVYRPKRYGRRPGSQELLIDGVNRDLKALRTEVALEGHRRGVVDIYGPGWPSGLSLEDSRNGVDGKDWHDRKLEILNNYKFNLAFENTTFGYYCTEKIWDPIRANSLPVYYGQHNRIYETFPKDSFIDYCEFGDPGKLFDFINEISESEYLLRMNRCIDVYNEAYRHKGFGLYEVPLRKFVEKVRSLRAKL